MFLTFCGGTYDSCTGWPCADSTKGAARRHETRHSMNRRFRVIVVTGMLLAGMSAVDGEAQFVQTPGTQFALSGVVVVEGQGRAWLQEPTLTQNRIVGIRVGESIGSYRLTKILEDRVEL